LEPKKNLKRRAHLIDDTPTTTDKFDSHTRIAKAIETLIRENDGGKTISIRGSWGSGKSTVIKLLKQRLQHDKKYQIVSYDAWVHSGDPLRRAFLCNLIDTLLEDKGWLTEDKQQSAQKYWDEQKSILARKTKTSRKTTTPTFTDWGKFFLGATLLWPISIPVFAERLKVWVAAGHTTASAFDFIALLGSGFCALLPVLIYASLLLSSQNYWRNC